MIERKLTQKEKRALSDERIIESAMHCFGNYGYSQCTISMIAKGAGVTPGLVIQRFQSKENLLIKTYTIATEDFFNEPNDCVSIKAAVISFIQLAQSLYKLDKTKFDLIKNCITNSDMPTGFIELRKELFSTRPICRMLLEEQKNGALPKADNFYLLSQFILLVLNQVDICNKYNISFPSENFFLKLFQQSDKEAVRREQKRELMLGALFNTFESLFYISIEKNTMEHMRVNEDTYPHAYSIDAHKSLIQLAGKTVSEKDRKKMIDFVELSSISDRLGSNNILLERCELNDGRQCIASFIPVKKNENGSLTEVLGGIQIIKTAKQTGGIY